MEEAVFILKCSNKEKTPFKKKWVLYCLRDLLYAKLPLSRTWIALREFPEYN